MAEPSATLENSTRQAPATAELAAEQRFAVVPEWMLDADVSDAAFRLYAVLARYGNTSGVRMPGRALLARRLRKSVDTVDRALRELTGAGVLEIERRQDGSRHLTNRYHLRTIDPDSSGRTHAATPCLEPQANDSSGRTPAATPATDQQTGAADERSSTATPRRTDAARVAAPMRPNPDVPTETPPPTPAAPRRAERVEEDPNGNCSTPAASPTSTPTPPRCSGYAATSANLRSAGPDPA